METEQERQQREIAIEIERDELRRRLREAVAAVSRLSARVEKLESRVSEVEELAEDADAEASETSDLTVVRQDSDDTGKIGSPAHHAYQVSVDNEGKVLCFLPKDPDGSYFPAAAGGKHLGASTGTTADEHAGPYPAGGQGSGSDEPAEWAHYGWYVVGTIDTESAEVNDKMVIATFVVPRDPAPGKIQPDTQVEGPKLAGIALYDADSWKEYAEQTWKEFDDQCSSLVRQVPIALIANGLVTQLTMMPYFYAPPKDKSCDGGSDSDSDGSDSDDDGCCPEYEIEKTSETSACTAEYKLKRTDCQGGVTYPGDTIEVPKPHTYTISAAGSSGCVQQSYKLMETNCSGSSAVGASIDIPKPPEYALTVSGGSCSKTISLTKTPCGGSGGTAVGDSFTFDVPPTISASATGSSGSSLAGTVYVTPCGGQTVPIPIYNGEDGEDGSDGDDGRGIVSITNTSTSGLVDTYTILYTDGTTSTFTVRNGYYFNGTIIKSLDSLAISNGQLVLTYTKVTYTNGAAGQDQQDTVAINVTAC